mmetsp:Transcript_10594/g.22451  ORF Transcript_10594/g.22451 Transcript_10594/m.22451 type:complete len:268 (+) Transcript_10594:327-1130(+)
MQHPLQSSLYIKRTTQVEQAVDGVINGLTPGLTLCWCRRLTLLLDTATSCKACGTQCKLPRVSERDSCFRLSVISSRRSDTRRFSSGSARARTTTSTSSRNMQSLRTLRRSAPALTLSYTRLHTRKRSTSRRSSPSTTCNSLTAPSMCSFAKTGTAGTTSTEARSTRPSVAAAVAITAHACTCKTQSKTTRFILLAVPHKPRKSKQPSYQVNFWCERRRLCCRRECRFRECSWFTCATLQASTITFQTYARAATTCASEEETFRASQ